MLICCRPSGQEAFFVGSFTQHGTLVGAYNIKVMSVYNGAYNIKVMSVFNVSFFQDCLTQEMQSVEEEHALTILSN